MHGSADDIVAEMADISRELIDVCGISIEDVDYVGVTAPGAVRDDGVVEYAPNLPFMNYDIGKKFKEILPVLSGP